MRLCSDGCGKHVSHYAQECFPVAPWDTPGLPPRASHERCKTHIKRGGRSTSETIHTVLCAYRDDDPARCPNCHTSNSKGCTCVSMWLSAQARHVAKEAA